MTPTAPPVTPDLAQQKQAGSSTHSVRLETKHPIKPAATPVGHLVCPFYRLDPREYSRCLGKYELKRWADLKQHLQRSHLSKYHCAACNGRWKDQWAFDAHSQSQGQECQLSDRDFDLFTEYEISRLNFNTTRLTDEEKYLRMWHMLFPAHEEPHSIYAKGSVLEEAADHIRRCTMAAYQAIIPSVTATTNNRQDGASMPGTLQGIFGACLNAYTDMPPRFRQPHNHGACVNPPDSTEAQILGPFTQHTANGFAFPSEMSMSKTTGMYCGYQSQGEVDNLGQHNPYHDESSHYTAAVPEDLAFIASLSPITFPAGYFNGDEQDNSFALNGDFGIDTVLIRENRHCVTMDTGPPSPQVANSMDALPVCLDFTAEPFGPSPTGFGLGFGGCSGATSPTTNHSAPS